MSGHEQVRTLMAQIGPVLELAEVLEQAERYTWILVDQDTTVLFAAPATPRMPTLANPAKYSTQ